MRQPAQSALTATASFLALQDHAANARNWHLRDLFASDPARFSRMSAQAAGLFLDYSKIRLNQNTLQLLLALAEERGVAAMRDAMLAGEKINHTEQRAVLHTALRAPNLPPFKQLQLDGQSVAHDVHEVLARMKDFSERVRSGVWRGHTGKPITDIVNIGIGGSDLGPKMVVQALRSYTHLRLKMHFVSNVDGHDLDAVLTQIDPATTLFIIASKTFTTLETMRNAHSARNWFLQYAASSDKSALARHFVAVSTNREAIEAFGIDPINMFGFWDWVGGRYSIWSSIGLPVMLAIGHGYFADFLAGAHAMDQHFATTPLAQNLPVLLALIGIWNRNFLGCNSLSIAAYHQDLARFPSYLQQLDMESNGKSVNREGLPVGVATCPVIWGDCGTNGQHAYFQLLHQGSDITPVDFIAALHPSHELEHHHAALLANCFAQSEALMCGKTAQEVRTELEQKNLPPAQIEALLPHKVFAGNRPSNTILMEMLTPQSLGALIALYEHKTLVQGVIWGINSFDQWGVELGKVLAKNIEAELLGQAMPALHDSSTNGLIAMAKTGW